MAARPEGDTVTTLSASGEAEKETVPMSVVAVCPFLVVPLGHPAEVAEGLSRRTINIL